MGGSRPGHPEGVCHRSVPFDFPSKKILATPVNTNGFHNVNAVLYVFIHRAFSTREIRIEVDSRISRMQNPAALEKFQRMIKLNVMELVLVPIGRQP